MNLSRSSGRKFSAHLDLVGAVRDVVVQAVGALDMVTCEHPASTMVSELGALSRLLVIRSDIAGWSDIVRRLRSTRLGVHLTICAIGSEFSDRTVAATVCKKTSVDVALPVNVPKSLFIQEVESAMRTRMPLVDFDVLPAEIAASLDKLGRSLQNDHYYALFSIGLRASPAEIKGRFHELAGTCHPDRYRGIELTNPHVFNRIHQLYKRVTEAYGVLSDPEKKLIYDLCLRRVGSIRYDPNRLDQQSKRELNLCSSPQAKIAVGQSLLARSLGDWATAESALRRAAKIESENGGLVVLLASVSSVRHLALADEPTGIGE